LTVNVVPLSIDAGPAGVNVGAASFALGTGSLTTSGMPVSGLLVSDTVLVSATAPLSVAPTLKPPLLLPHPTPVPPHASAVVSDMATSTANLLVLSLRSLRVITDTPSRVPS
jgi:hypothetical protein